MYSSLDLLNGISLQVTSWCTSTRSRRAGDRVQGGSARNSWLCVQRRLPQHGEKLARVCYLEPQEIQGAAGGSPSIEPTSTASLPIQHRHPRAAHALFLGPQAQVSPPCPLPELYQNNEEWQRLLPSHTGGMGSLLPSSSFLFQELSHSTLSAYTQGRLVTCRGGVLRLQSHTAMSEDSGSGQRQSSALPSW